MLPAVSRLASAIAKTSFQSLRYPIVTNVDAQLQNDSASLSELLTKQMVSPVLWEVSLQRMLEMGIDHFYEIGAGRVLAGTLKRVNRKAACECFGD
jgi:[acyl-carrier-protein] S-malonyltransferase